MRVPLKYERYMYKKEYHKLPGVVTFLDIDVSTSVDCMVVVNKKLMFRFRTTRAHIHCFYVRTII